MPIHFDREVEILKRKIISLGGSVEQNFWNAIRALEDRNAELANRVIVLDEDIDSQEVTVEEECLKILALYQPVAMDLRFIISLLKINNDLERIGDLASNIAERVMYLSDHPRVTLPLNFIKMGELAKEMVKESLDSLMNLDSNLAKKVCASDEELDELNREMYVKIKESIERDIDNVSSYLQFLSISRYLERIADHATNIAQDVIYMIEGKIIRHIKPQVTS